MKTRCKFYVSKVAHCGYPGSPTQTAEEVTLQAVHGELGGPENKSFSAATPSGQITILVSNPAVIGTFTPGAYYYVDLIPVPSE